MADQAEVIRQQMADTRASMTEKIEALEKQVTETVKETTDTVSETVDVASETVKDTVEAISGTVDAFRETFDIPGHIQRHPWLALGGVMALGYALGHLLTPSRRHEAQPVAVPVPTPTPTPYQSAMHTPTHTPTPTPAPTPTSASCEEKHPNLGDVLGNLKEVAIGTTIGLLGQMILNAVPADVRGNLSGLVTQFTEAMGGKPLKS